MEARVSAGIAIAGLAFFITSCVKYTLDAPIDVWLFHMLAALFCAIAVTGFWE
jgi:hypothetical protein